MKIYKSLLLLSLLFAGCQAPNPVSTTTNQSQIAPENSFRTQKYDTLSLMIPTKYQAGFHHNTFAYYQDEYFSAGNPYLTMRIMDVQGDNQQNLVDIPIRLGAPANAVWSPQHDKLALILYSDYIRGDIRHQTTIAIVKRVASQNQLTVIYQGPSTYIRSGLKWSPDGQRLAFTTLNNGQEYLTLLTADGMPQPNGGGAMIRLGQTLGMSNLTAEEGQTPTHPVYLSEDSTFDRFFWLDDSQHLLFSKEDDIYKISVNNQIEKVLTGASSRFVLSPDQQQLAFFKRNPNNSSPSLYTYELNGSYDLNDPFRNRPRPKIRPMNEAEFSGITASKSLRWSSDNKHLAFVGIGMYPLGNGSYGTFNKLFSYNLQTEKMLSIMPQDKEIPFIIRTLFWNTDNQRVFAVGSEPTQHTRSVIYSFDQQKSTEEIFRGQLPFRAIDLSGDAP